MEWYFRSDGDDLVVPRDREQLDSLPSPNSWSDWGISEFPKKEFDGKIFCEEIDINISNNEMDCSSNSSMAYGLNSGLHQWEMLTCRQPDYQMSDMDRMDQMNDIYLNSLLDEDVDTENFYGSSTFSPSSPYSMMSSDNLTTEKILESEHTTCEMGGSTHSFSPSADWNRKFVPNRPPIKAPVFKDPVSPEHDDERQYVGEDTCPEESALEELERVTSKLTARTRNCFKDSLYRLAENSKRQTANQHQNGNRVVEKNLVDGNTLRVEEMEARESKTNAIDRAIASLMFTKMDFCAEDSSVAATLNFQREVKEKPARLQYNLDNQRPYGFTILESDAEVPIISRKGLLPPTTNLHRDFSGGALEVMSRN